MLTLIWDIAKPAFSKIFSGDNYIDALIVGLF